MSIATPLAAAGAPAITRGAGPRIVVVGAGAFGGWTALWLRRSGADVTLVDAWGPGNQRAASSGETRIVRGTYGSRAIYTTMTARAMQLWKEHDARAARTFFHRVGALWIFTGDETFGEESIAPMRAAGLATEWVSPAAAAKRWPQFSYDGVSRVLWEPDAGYALARRACEHVVETFVAEGGTYRVGRVRELRGLTGPIESLALEDGTTLRADRFVIAAGPWLGSLVPDAVGARIRPSRQESFYFGTPAGDAQWQPPQLPVWLEYGPRLFYGIPGNANRGFKIADDTAGPTFDPTNGDRAHTADGLAVARAHLRTRFPALADAPFLGSEVCQYELSSDSHFIIDRHPGARNVWLVGGGSGHGYKMGPSVGEDVAKLVLADGTPEAVFRLER